MPDGLRFRAHRQWIDIRGKDMAIRSFIKGIVLLLLLNAGTAHALGTFIPAPRRADMAYDEKRDLVYISSASSVLRYRVHDQTFLSPIDVGGSLRGIDLSPDGDTLAVADAFSSETKLWVHLIDLDALTVRRMEATKQSYVAGEYYEWGTWAVSYANDGSLLATSRYPGSGSTPMRRFYPVDGTVMNLAIVQQNTMVSASGDRTAIAFAESNSSDGPWGRYDPATGEIVRRDWYQNGTMWFNYEIATNIDGSQYAIPTYGGTFIYDSSYLKIATLGIYAGPQPIGVAYHPVDHLAYFPWKGTQEVRVYDMDAIAHVGSYDFELVFDYPDDAFGEGRTRLSGDGSLLMVSVEGGVRILRMYAPLKAEPITVRIPNNFRIPDRFKRKIVLNGSVGNGGQVQYEIVSKPLHGRVTLNRDVATYWRTGGGTGTDSFVYRARYGRAIADAMVTITP